MTDKGIILQMHSYHNYTNLKSEVKEPITSKVPLRASQWTLYMYTIVSHYEFSIRWSLCCHHGHQDL